jgi:hypothetical protein
MHDLFPSQGLNLLLQAHYKEEQKHSQGSVKKNPPGLDIFMGE